MTTGQMRTRIAAQDTAIRHMTRAARRLLDKMAIASVDRHTGAFKPELDDLERALAGADEAKRTNETE